MSIALVFVSQTKPAKGLIETRKFKAFLSPERKDEIIAELEKTGVEIDEWDINIHVEIELNKYETKHK